MSTHLVLDGQWEGCATPESCSLPLHVEMAPAAAAQIPLHILEQLFEAFDPPSRGSNTTMVKRWDDSDRRAHRDYDLPAIIHRSGQREWLRRGKHHREHGPAVIHGDGQREWLQDGQWHRMDGPAITYPDSSEEYWEHGNFLYGINENGKRWYYTDDGTLVTETA